MSSISNTLHTADCLETLRTVPAGSVTLAYMDPPFNTGGKRSMGVRRGKRPNGPVELTDPIDFGGTPEIKTPPGYADRFGSPAAYIAYMRPRIEAVRAALTPDGSLFYHCDWRASHHVKILLDEVFVAQGGVFVNEIIWRYGLGASRPGRKLLSKHDTIFWVARGPDYTFNLIRQAVSPAMHAKYSHTDEDGRRYMNCVRQALLSQGWQAAGRCLGNPGHRRHLARTRGLSHPETVGAA